METDSTKPKYFVASRKEMIDPKKDENTLFQPQIQVHVVDSLEETFSPESFQTRNFMGSGSTPEELVQSYERNELKSKDRFPIRMFDVITTLPAPFSSITKWGFKLHTPISAEELAKISEGMYGTIPEE